MSRVFSCKSISAFRFLIRFWMESKSSFLIKISPWMMSACCSLVFYCMEKQQRVPSMPTEKSFVLSKFRRILSIY